MAEALAAVGAASSIVQLLDFTVKVTTRLCVFLKDSNNSPESFRAIQLELPFFVEALRETKSHLDLELYTPSAVAAIQCLVGECTSLMATLDAMLAKSVPRKDDSKMARSRKAVYGVSREKLILALNAKISEYTKKLLLYQGATSSRLLMKSLDRLLGDRSLFQPLSVAPSPARNETELSLMGDMKIARRKNRAARSSQYQFSSSVNLSRLGIFWNVHISLNLSWERGSYTLCPSLQAQRLVKRTSPGFEVFWKCDNYFMELSDGLVELRRLFQDGLASPFDADPEGKTWSELLLDFRGAGDAKVRREFLKVLNECNARISTSIPIQSICYPVQRCVLPTLNANFLIEESDDASILLDILIQDNPNGDIWGGYNQSLDPFYLELIRKFSKHAYGLWNQTSLMDAILCGTAADIVSCIEHKVPLDDRNSFGQTAMHLAVLRPSVVALLIQAGAQVDIKDNAGVTPLCYTIWYGCAETMTLLLEAGANPFLPDEPENLTKFPEKVLNDVIDSYVANWLETLGLDFEFPSLTGFSALLDSGINPNVTSKSNVTLLHCVAGGHEVHALFRAGFTKVDQLDDLGNSPLMNALRSYCRPESTYKAILTHGADVNLRNNHGTSAMHILCEAIGSHYPTPDNLKGLSMKFERAAICLSYGADPLARDNCQCHCSVNGCSPTTLLLNRFRKDNWRVVLLAFEWLLMLKEYRGITVADAAVTDLVRSMQFNLLGLTHVCEMQVPGVTGRHFLRNEIDEILDRENDNIQCLEESMLCFKQRPDHSIEGSWVYVLSSLHRSDFKTTSEVWNLGLWKRSAMQNVTPQSTTPWKSSTELVSHWTPELRGAHWTSYCFVDKLCDEYRLAVKHFESTVKPNSELYSKWVEYVFEHKDEFEFPRPLDAEWLQTRRYWAAQQVKRMAGSN
ncbi:hypothetical protein ACJ72_07006 [Emergomyces africanus]|uniref:NACHT-NTPase and P-loop NTPases N-terminal domain-containing protein n=1 Tax=Emergomyces africanus TaxID=1955775 RepID=A0A1B7NPD4_9EURO|nr:hypothetical protein ACJ72_07006 [Emergomyces africanus]